MPQAQFPILSRVKSVFSGIGLAAILVVFGLGYRVQSNPNHPTTEYPESMQMNGVIRYMTVAQKRAIEFAFLASFLCTAASISLAYYKDRTE
jgi:hypothetical protein